MAGKKDALEHQHPEPGEGHDDAESREAEDNEIGARSEDLGAEFEDADGACETVPSAYDAHGPDDGHDGRHEGQPAHDAVLDARTVVGAFEAADEWVEGEGEKDDGHGE